MPLREDARTVIILLLTAFLFFGAVTVLSLVVTFNPVNPSSVHTITFFIVFGLGSGVTAGVWVTNGELRVLNKSGEFKMMSNLSFMYASVIGLPVFFPVTFSLEILGRAFFLGEVFFLLAGLFAFSLLRLILLVRWETRNKKVVMVQHGTFFSSGRLYVS
jgi:hypothetical protein